MAHDAAGAPSLDEYVAARGGDLLRVAWVLTGDRASAEDLVRRTLARAWPRWRHLVSVGAGSYDAELRRTLVDQLGRVRARTPPAVAPDDVALALRGLRRPERVALVLWALDDLSDAQVADALDVGVAAARAHLRAARDRVHLTVPVRDDELRERIGALAPSDPPTDGLAERSRAYAGRARRVRDWALAVGALALAAVVAGVVGAGLRAGPGPVPGPSGPAPAVLDCLRPADASAAVPPAGPVWSSRFTAVLVCAQTGTDSAWVGFLPSSERLDDPRALDLLTIAPRDDGVGCGSLPQGPAFRILLQGKDGRRTTFANEAMRCDGWPALDSYYRAVAEQQAARAAASPRDGFLACPPWFPPERPEQAEPPLVRGTVLTAATVCLHPLADPTSVPEQRPVLRLVLGQAQLALLNRDLAARGSTAAGAPRCGVVSRLFVVRVLTTDQRVVELTGSCPSALRLGGAGQQWVRLGPDSAGVVESVVGPSYLR